MSNQRQVIIFAKGQIDGEDKKLLIDAGYVPIEVENPESVIFATPNLTNLGGDGVLRAALKAMQNRESSGERQRFAEYIMAEILKAQPMSEPVKA